MSKAVLVMDMPDNCFKCKLQDWANCRIAKRCHTGDRIPDWCPLKPMPSKKDDDFYDWDKANQIKGYNACIDELLKGEEG